MPLEFCHYSFSENAVGVSDCFFRLIFACSPCVFDLPISRNWREQVLKYISPRQTHGLKHQCI